MVAIAVLLLLHAPPDADSLKVVVNPAQTFCVPVIAEGTAFIVTVTVLAQPETRV